MLRAENLQIDHFYNKSYSASSFSFLGHTQNKHATCSIAASVSPNSTEPYCNYFVPTNKGSLNVQRQKQGNIHKWTCRSAN